MSRRASVLIPFCSSSILASMIFLSSSSCRAISIPRYLQSVLEISASPSIRRRAVHRLLILPPVNASTAGWRRAMALSTDSSYKTFTGLTFCSPFTTQCTASFNSRRPSFFLALVPITGTPNMRESFLRSMEILFLPASSIRLTHTTMLSVISMIWSTRFRFLSRHVASVTTTVTSGSPKQMKSLAASSSAEFANKEYVPGKSIR